MPLQFVPLHVVLDAALGTLQVVANGAKRLHQERRPNPGPIILDHSAFITWLIFTFEPPLRRKFTSRHCPAHRVKLSASRRPSVTFD